MSSTKSRDIINILREVVKLDSVDSIAIPHDSDTKRMLLKLGFSEHKDFMIIRKNACVLAIANYDKRIKVAEEVIARSHDNVIRTLEQLSIQNRSLEQYQLFNPFHDNLGRFASRSGGGGASGDTKSGLVNSQERKAVINQARSKGGFLKTTGQVLGLATLGAVGLAVIGSIPVEAEEQPEIDPDLINRIKEAEKAGKLDTSNWPKAGSPEELQRQVTEMLKAGGITDIPADLKIVVDDSLLPPGTGGAYLSHINTYVIRSSYLAKIGDGDPNAYWATIHEIAHSAQETQAEGNSNGFLVNIDDKDGSFRGYFEGQNDLVTAITISRAYGQPMTHETTSNMSAQLALDKTGIGFASTVGYPEETRTWAGIATAWEQKTGENAIGFVTRAHDEGLHTDWQRQNVMWELFPERMGDYDKGWPPPTVVAGWLATDYDVDTNQAFSEMLEDALNE